MAVRRKDVDSQDASSDELKDDVMDVCVEAIMVESNAPTWRRFC